MSVKWDAHLFTHLFTYLSMHLSPRLSTHRSTPLLQNLAMMLQHRHRSIRSGKLALQDENHRHKPTTMESRI
jgi:hypothetical protein